MAKSAIDMAVGSINASIWLLFVSLRRRSIDRKSDAPPRRRKDTLVGVSVDKIVVNASAERVAAAVKGQLEKLHNEGSVEIKNGGGGV
jgi:hypothetical protein